MPPYLPRAGRSAARRAAAALLLGLLPLAVACSTDALLKADDPDIIDPDDLNSPSAALALRTGALERFRTITAGDESTWLFGGLLADEWGTSSTFVQNDETDQRRIQTNNSTITTMYRALNRVRTASNQAIAALNTFHPDSSTAIASMYFARGFAEMQLAQDFCSALPMSDASGEELILAPISTTVEVFERAVASYDSALALVGTATADSARAVARAARVGKARALLGLGRFAEAGPLVTTAAVPTSFAYRHTFALSSGDNTIWGQGLSARRYLVGDSLEGNARALRVANNLPFFSAGDPRLPARYTISSRGDTTKSQDGQTYSRTTTLYGRSTPIDVVNGIDARLVEAEVALQANNPGGMLAILNALRAAPPQVGTVTPTAAQLPPLTLPATRDAQIDLLFREKAFWTFSRGQRLGDLRRLMRAPYSRPQELVFPTGAHYRGGEYGTDVTLPVPQEEDTNPQFGPAGRQACVTSVP